MLHRNITLLAVLGHFLLQNTPESASKGHRFRDRPAYQGDPTRLYPVVQQRRVIFQRRCQPVRIGDTCLS